MLSYISNTAQRANKVGVWVMRTNSKNMQADGLVSPTANSECCAQACKAAATAATVQYCCRLLGSIHRHPLSVTCHGKACDIKLHGISTVPCKACKPRLPASLWHLPVDHNQV